MLILPMPKYSNLFYWYISQYRHDDIPLSLSSTGSTKEALEWAMSRALWGHALLLSSKMASRVFAQVLTRFANSSMTHNDPLQTLYQLMSQRQPNASTVWWLLRSSPSNQTEPIKSNGSSVAVRWHQTSVMSTAYLCAVISLRVGHFTAFTESLSASFTLLSADMYVS
mgnify:CR=1 FL=1